MRSSSSSRQHRASGTTVGAALLIAFGLALLLPNPASARSSSSYCAQVRQAVATYGYTAARRHALAHYGPKAVRAGDRCLAGGHHRRA